jgi:hypothetical protein
VLCQRLSLHKTIQDYSTDISKQMMHMIEMNYSDGSYTGFHFRHMNRGHGQFPEFGDRGDRTCSMIDQALSQESMECIF